MNEHRIDCLTDPWLEPYRDLRHKNWIEASGWFIAEGPLLTERLLNSDYACHSVLLDDRHYARFRPLIPASVPVLRCPQELVERILGFNFHRGVLACGIRKQPQSLEDALAKEQEVGKRTPVVVLHGVQDPENIGGILRTSAALGIETVVIGPGCADPLSRRSLRVSMGNALKLQLVRCHRLERALSALRASGFTIVATSLGPAAETLEDYRCPERLAVLFGNERHGLPNHLLQQSDVLLRIEMADGVDSLNVGVAAGIILHYLSRIAPRVRWE